jgi:hypothetical protein
LGRRFRTGKTTRHNFSKAPAVLNIFLPKPPIKNVDTPAASTGWDLIIRPIPNSLPSMSIGERILRHAVVNSRRSKAAFSISACLRRAMLSRRLLTSRSPQVVAIFAELGHSSGKQTRMSNNRAAQFDRGHNPDGKIKQRETTDRSDPTVLPKQSNEKNGQKDDAKSEPEEQQEGKDDGLFDPFTFFFEFCDE